MSDYDVPKGWRQGEPITIDKASNGNYVVAQRINPYHGTQLITPGELEEIAYITFYSHLDLIDWLKWWYNEPIHELVMYEAGIH